MKISDESRVSVLPLVKLCIHCVEVGMEPDADGAQQEVQQVTAGPEGSIQLSVETLEDAVTQEEMNELQMERMSAVRRAIASGAYDSDEILQKAFARMIQRIDDESGL